MKNIAIDLDDTILDFNELARQILSAEAVRTGDAQLKAAAFSEWNQWRVPPDLIGMKKWLEIISMCHDPEVIDKRIPYPDAPETIWELVNSGNKITYISNRHGDCYESSYKWLLKNDFPVEDNGASMTTKLICTQENKMEHIRECQYIIDDRPKTLVQFVHDFDWKNKHGSNNNPRKAFGLMRPYNSSLTDVPGIYLAPSWKLLREFLVEKELICV